jgi:predicted nucleotidyltransferase
MIPPDKRQEIQARLDAIERHEGVRMLYACESGSRAWGFPSADSDYDVRFIYAHPAEWYLSIQTRRDVIERPLENLIDESGWDIRKALNLLRKSNPPLLEWIQSPIVYRADTTFLEDIRTLMAAYYSPRQCMHHYLHMARGNIREYLKGERVWVKKYFYVLRPILACRWIEAGLGVVPMEFGKLVDGVALSPDLRGAIERLLADKLAGREMDDGPRVPMFHEFFDSEMARLERIAGEIPAGDTRDFEQLDALFRSAIGWTRTSTL